MSKLEEIYKKLTAEFPQEAYSADITRKDKILTSLKAQYITERLNEVLGIGNWKLDGDWDITDDGVLFVGELSYTVDDKTYTTGKVPGYSDSDNLGDAFKGARTDCLSKAASYLGVGNEMYKGKIEPVLSDWQREKLGLDNKPEEKSEDSSPRSKFRTNSKQTAKPAETETQPEEQDEAEEEADKRPPAKLKSSRMFGRGKLASKFKSHEGEKET